MVPRVAPPRKVGFRFSDKAARKKVRIAALAQPVEHRIRNAGVTCSSHVGGTIKRCIGESPKSNVATQLVRRFGDTMTPYDPRAVANLFLDEADRRSWKITNLALQKLLYFAHGIHLTKKKQPLVSGYFEAWQYGPVHPAVYQAFKPSGSAPIINRALAKDPLTGVTRELPKLTDLQVTDLVIDVLKSYGQLPPGRLVDLSHAKDAPWSAVVDKARTDIAFGMRIPDDLIIERFRHHKVSVGRYPRVGEPPSDDTPFA
jgi:uncharacterized phage-associated protein